MQQRHEAEVFGGLRRVAENKAGARTNNALLIKAACFIATFRYDPPARRGVFADEQRIGGGDGRGRVWTRNAHLVPSGRCGNAHGIKSRARKAGYRFCVRVLAVRSAVRRVAADGSSSRRPIRFARLAHRCGDAGGHPVKRERADAGLRDFS